MPDRTGRVVAVAASVVVAALAGVLAWLGGAEPGGAQPVGGPSVPVALHGARPDGGRGVLGPRPAPDTVGIERLGDGDLPQVSVAHLLPHRGHERLVLLQPDLITVRGRVLDADGRPVEGADVRFYDLGKGGAPRNSPDQERDVTDAEGRFEVSDSTRWEQPPYERERWRVSIRADGHAPWHGIPVTAGIAEDVVLPRSRFVTLVLLADDGQPLADALVREFSSVVQYPYRAPRRSWELGRTDAAGRLPLFLATDHQQPVVELEHPDHRGKHMLPRAALGFSEVVLRVSRDRSVEARWVGDMAAWEARGLELPDIDLTYLEPVFTATHSPTPERWNHTSRDLDGWRAFEHLSGAPVAFVIAEPLTILSSAPYLPQPGRHAVDLELPLLPPLVPGETPWGVTLELLDGTGERYDTERPSWGRLPRVELVGADGTVERHRYGSRSEVPSRLTTTLAPPVSARFAGWPDGPRQDGVGPGDVLRLTLDEGRLPEWSGTVRLDTSLLDDVRREGAWLEVETDSDLQRSTSTRRGLIRGVVPGTWIVDVSGDGIVRDRREHALAAGDELVLIAAPGPMKPPKEPEPDEPDEPATPATVLLGTVTLVGDPYARAESVLLVPEGVTAAEVRYANFDAKSETGAALSVGASAFGGPVLPGDYDVVVSVTRFDSMGYARVFGAGYGSLGGTQESLAPDGARHVTITEGETTRLDLTVTLERPRSPVFVEVRVDGRPREPDPVSRTPWSVSGRWIPDDGGEPVQVSGGLHDSALFLALPVGAGRLALELSEVSAFMLNGRRPSAGEVAFFVPPGDDPSRAPRVVLDLVSGEPLPEPPEDARVRELTPEKRFEMLTQIISSRRR
jgi:hypothetical protein